MNADEVIGNAKPEMRYMLRSVYQYNSIFVRTKKEKDLLLRILEAMSVIDRRFFVTDKTYTYGDTALSIGEGQTISQPSTVARALFLAELKQGDNVLEIGTGSGWNASLIAFLVHPGNVISIERIFSLLKNANKNIEALRKNLKKHKERLSKLQKCFLCTHSNLIGRKKGIFDSVQKLKHALDFSLEFLTIKLIAKDIFSVKAWNEKYDKIIFTAGIANSKAEKAILTISRKLLNKNGILVCPYTSGPMLIVKKGKDNEINVENTREEYVFVPLIEGTE